MKLLYIGYITGPFGLKGEVKILSETNHKNDIFKVGNSLYIDNKKYIIESVKQNPNCEVIKFLGIDDISLTDEILKKEVYVNRNEINVDYLLIELMNMDVYDNDKLMPVNDEKAFDMIDEILNHMVEETKNKFISRGNVRKNNGFPRLIRLTTSPVASMNIG